MSKFDAVIFDYGNVLSLEQSPELIQQMVTKLKTDVSEFEHQYWHFRLEYDRGDFGGREYWSRIGKALGQPVSVEFADELTEIDNRSWSLPNEPIVEWSHSLKAKGIKIAILSNMPSDFRRDLARNCTWLPGFDHHTYSCELKIVKPDAGIYEHCLAGLGVKPERVLFLDDRLPNIEASEKLGIAGLHVLRTEDVLFALQAAFGWEPQHTKVPQP